LLVLPKFLKNVGREVEIVLVNGTKKAGILKEASDENLVLETTRQEKPEGKKKKETIVEAETLPMSEIKETKIVISFK
jgi:ribosome maturation factor RimP